MKYLLIKFTIVFSLLLLVGCSALTELRLDMADKIYGREGPNQPAELEEIDAKFNAKIDWSKQLGRTEKYDYLPVVEAGAVYSANAKGDLYKIDVTTGQEVWRAEVGEPISGSVGTGGGIVMAGTSRGNVVAYTVDGKPLWKVKISSQVLSAPRYFDGIVVVRAGDSHIYGLDAADGTKKWVYERTIPALSLRSSAGIVIDGGAVYAGFAGGKMVAIRSDNGKTIWEAVVARPKGVTEIERIADITSLPVVNGPIVYAVAYQGRVAAIDRLSGKVIWNREISSYSGMSFDEEKLYISHALGSLYSLHYDTGRTFWRQGALLNRRLTSPLPMGNLVAVGDIEGYVHFVNKENGKIVARVKVDDDAVMGLVLGASLSQVIVTTRHGGLYSINTEDNTSETSSSSDDLFEAKPEPETLIEGAEAEVSQETDSPTTIEAESETEEVEESTETETPRSILFKKDAILLPEDLGSVEIDDSGPGIKLPKAQ